MKRQAGKERKRYKEGKMNIRWRDEISMVRQGGKQERREGRPKQGSQAERCACLHTRLSPPRATG
jgi:hypothetical protein